VEAELNSNSIDNYADFELAGIGSKYKKV